MLFTLSPFDRIDTFQEKGGERRDGKAEKEIVEKRKEKVSDWGKKWVAKAKGWKVNGSERNGVAERKYKRKFYCIVRVPFSRKPCCCQSSVCVAHKIFIWLLYVSPWRFLARWRFSHLAPRRRRTWPLLTPRCRLASSGTIDKSHRALTNYSWHLGRGGGGGDQG